MLVDLNSTYPAMFSLLGLTPHLVADHFEAVPVDPAEVEELFRTEGLRDRVDNRAFYRSIGNLFVIVEPHGEAKLPCQREVGPGRYRFVVAPLDLCGGTIPIHACHLIGPGLAGRLPKVVSALRVEPLGVAPDRKPLRLPSGAEIDLAADGADYGQALIAERQRAEAITDPLRRDHRVALAKSLAVSGAWGVFARVDRRRPKAVETIITDTDGKERRIRTYPRSGTVLAYGPCGDQLRIEAERLDVPGSFTLWHVAAAIPAACTGEIAIARHDIEVTLGGTVALVATDAIAASGLTSDELRSVLTRRDKVLHPNGGSAWKIECDSLDKPTIGLVVGVNKLLLGRHDSNGVFRLLRSSDTGSGDHFLDPTGTGARLDDSRMAWPATLQEAFLADVHVRGNTARLRVPPKLPCWAEQPALRPGRASTLEDLRRLRRKVGDASVGPFARYAIAPTGGAHPPVCLGIGRDPMLWRLWPWMRNGKPCRVGVQDSAGHLVASEGSGAVFVVPTHREAFRGWFSENDVTVGGPRRGVRHVLPVRSHPALLGLVGRSGELAGERIEDDPIAFPPGSVRQALISEVSRLSAAEVGRRGRLSRFTARDVLKGSSLSESTLRRLIEAAVDLEPIRCAAAAECRDACDDGLGAVLDRRHRRWCSEPCRKIVYRRRHGIPARRRRNGRLGLKRMPEAAVSTNGSGIPVAKGLDKRAIAGEPSCPACGSIFSGRVPDLCTDCGAPLPEREST